MTEKRLIDADDLLIAFGNALNNATLKIGYGFMEQVVNEQPTVDPESLRGHAKWVRKAYELPILRRLRVEQEAQAKDRQRVIHKVLRLPL